MSPEEQGGPPVDWDKLYEESGLSLRSIIRRRVRANDVDDALQETFLRAYKSRHRLDATSPVTPWLAVIARRTACDVYRSAPDEAQHEQREEGVDTTWEGFERREQARTIGLALRALNARHRRLLFEHEVNGVPCRELAAGERVSEDAVAAALARARKAFRRHWEDIVAAAFLVRLRRLRLTQTEPLPQLVAGLVVAGSAIAGLLGVAVIEGRGPRAALGGAEPDRVAAIAVVSSRAGQADNGIRPNPEGGTWQQAAAPPWDAAQEWPTPSPRPLVPSVGSNTSFDFEPTRSTIGLTVTVDNSITPGSGSTGLTIDCTGASWEVVCTSLQGTPTAP